MNERIKELAEQAWDATAVSPDFGHPVTFAEKFAELIVRECAAVAGKFVHDNKYNEEGISEFWLKDGIKEHFGVEE